MEAWSIIRLACYLLAVLAVVSAVGNHQRTDQPYSLPEALGAGKAGRPDPDNCLFSRTPHSTPHITDASNTRRCSKDSGANLYLAKLAAIVCHLTCDLRCTAHNSLMYLISVSPAHEAYVKDKNKMKLLHIVATPREDHSSTLRVSHAFLESMNARYPDLHVEEFDLFHRELPAVAGDNIEAKYTLMIGQPLDKLHQESWKQIEDQIAHFLSADIYVISSPMWNFGIPYSLKFYIDAIFQPGYLFKYDELGRAIGLVRGKKMVCITSRGSDYSENSPYRPYDFVEPYLRAAFGFVGITDLFFINAQPMDVSPQLRETAIAKAIAEAHHLAADLDWRVDETVAHVENPPELKPAPLPKS